jgi:hypothetical protein
MVVRLVLHRLSFCLAACWAGSVAGSAPAHTEVRIITEPEGAEVFIGNVRLGVAPRGGFRLVADAAGTITYTIRKDGFVPVERRVTLSRGGPNPMIVRVHLEPAAPGGEPPAVAAPDTPAPAASLPRSPGQGAPSPPRAQPAAASSTRGGGSHKGLLLGGIGAAAAAGAGAAVASNRGGDAAGGGATGSAATLSGDYSGTVQDSRGGGGAVNVTLTHSTAYITGTWRGPEPVWRALNGTVSGGAIAATLLPSVATACPYSLAATASGDRISGTFTSFSCATPVSGTVDLTRR